MIAIIVITIIGYYAIITTIIKTDGWILRYYQLLLMQMDGYYATIITTVGSMTTIINITLPLASSSSSLNTSTDLLNTLLKGEKTFNSHPYLHEHFNRSKNYNSNQYKLKTHSLIKYNKYENEQKRYAAAYLKQLLTWAAETSHRPLLQILRAQLYRWKIIFIFQKITDFNAFAIIYIQKRFELKDI